MEISVESVSGFLSKYHDCPISLASLFSFEYDCFVLSPLRPEHETLLLFFFLWFMVGT